MSDFTLSVAVGRSALGLGDLEINDHTSYYVASDPGLFEGQIDWDRQTVSSPDVDGDFTVSRRRGNVEESLVVEIIAASSLDMWQKVGNLKNAVSQDRFNLTITYQGQVTTWVCETASYSLRADSARLAIYRPQMALVIPRKPVPTAGAL